MPSPRGRAAPLRRAGGAEAVAAPPCSPPSRAGPPVPGLAPPPSGGAGEEGRGRKAEDLPCGAGARRMRTAGQVRGALTSWHSPLPLLAVTLYIRVTCPPRSEPPPLLPPPPGSSRLRHRGRCGGAPGPAAAAAPLRARGSL